MNPTDAETTIEGVTISTRAIRRDLDFYPVEHIQSVHVVENCNWGFHLSVAGGYFLFGIFAAADSRPIVQYFGWAFLFIPFAWIPYIMRAGPHSYDVTITVGGRRHTLAQFHTPTTQMSKVHEASAAAARAKAESIAQAVQALL